MTLLAAMSSGSFCASETPVEIIRHNAAAKPSRRVLDMACSLLPTIIGLSSRVNEEGARQVEEVLRSQGVELLKVTLTGYRLHIDGLFVMLAPDLALANITLLPFWFLERLDALGIRRIEVHHEDDGSIINSLAIAPGRVIMPEGVSEHTQDQLRLAGVQAITVPYDKMIAGGDGLHCSTAPLVRDED